MKFINEVCHVLDTLWDTFLKYKVIEFTALSCEHNKTLIYSYENI